MVLVVACSGLHIHNCLTAQGSQLPQIYMVSGTVHSSTESSFWQPACGCSRTGWPPRLCPMLMLPILPHASVAAVSISVVPCPLQTPIKDSHAASKAILDLEGVVDHGLFLDMVDVCIIAGGNGVEVQERKK